MGIEISLIGVKNEKLQKILLQIKTEEEVLIHFYDLMQIMLLMNIMKNYKQLKQYEDKLLWL